jgi:hypothetical protein
VPAQVEPLVGELDWQPLAEPPPTPEPPDTEPPTPQPEPQPGPPEPPVDNHAPVCKHVNASPRRLHWRTDRRLHPVRLTGGRDADGDPIDLRVIWIGQSEPDVGARDGAFSTEPNVALLRDARTNRKTGRIYWVDYQLVDKWGARCIGTKKVTVPRRGGRRALPTGHYYNSVPVFGGNS